MNRIGDINDPHEEGSDISNVSDLGGNEEKKRRTKLVAGTIGIIFMASIAVGILVAPSNNSLAGKEHGVNLQVGYNLPDQQQRFLDIAQHVLSACSENQMNKSMEDCQTLCHGKLCCFERDVGSGYDCREDESINCPVYAGCEALVQGVPVDGATKSTERRIKWG